MAKKSAMLVLDSQKLELNIPLKGIYDFASESLKTLRFRKAEKIIRELKKSGIEAIVIALDSETGNFLRKRKIGFASAKNAFGRLYDAKLGEASYEFLQNLIRAIEEADETTDYKGIPLPDLDAKNLWRSFAFPAITAFDTFSRLLKKYKPHEAIILNNEHFFQKIFNAAAEASGAIIEDRTGSFAKLPWIAKRAAMKNIGFVAMPPYLRKLKKGKPFGESKKAKKKILISHDTVSSAKIIPWAKKLAKDYEVVYIGVRDSGDEFEKNGIAYRKLQDYSTERIINELKTAREIFRKTYKNVFGNPKIVEAMSYKGVDMRGIFEEMMLYLHYISYPILAAYVELFNEMIEREKPDLIITVDELSRFGRTLVRVSNYHGIKTLIVQHGALLNHPLFSSIRTEKFAAYGEQTKDILLKRGARAEQIEIVGQAEEVPKEKEEIARARVCTKLNMPKRKPIIVFASQALPESVNYPSFRIFYNAAKELPNVQFVVKLHPDESEIAHNEFVEKLGLENVIVVKDINTKELLLASDIVANIYSTVGMEALSLGKPLISINANLPESYFPKGRGACTAKTAKNFKSAVNGILKQNRRILSENVKKLSGYYIKASGEEACENVAKLVKNLLA